MAVFTPVSEIELADWLADYKLGKLVNLKGIASGIENTNFFVTTELAGEQHDYVLTIFEKLTLTELPFYLYLMQHLAERGITVPAPMINRHGEILGTLKGKPAAMVTRLKGASQMAPSVEHCAQVGAELARMHQAGRDYPRQQPNLRGLAWWRTTVPEVLPYLTSTNQQLLQSELAYQESIAASTDYARLPVGPVHADLFRDNVLFDGDRLGGFFDFYFAGWDTWLFDLAVCANDWCIDYTTGQLNALRTRAMLLAYHGVQPLDELEHALWPAMLRAGALRFWLSRLYDFYLPRAAAMLTPHDPSHFERILKNRIASTPIWID